jgi:hypothetical protein
MRDGAPQEELRAAVKRRSELFAPNVIVNEFRRRVAEFLARGTNAR